MHFLNKYLYAINVWKHDFGIWVLWWLEWSALGKSKYEGCLSFAYRDICYRMPSIKSHYKKITYRPDTYNIRQCSTTSVDNFSLVLKIQMWGLRDDPRAGASKTVDTQETVVAVRNLIKEDRHVTNHVDFFLWTRRQTLAVCLGVTR